MSENILNDISKVYLEKIAVNEAVRGADNELRRAASKERQAEKAADKEFRSSKAGTKKAGPKLSTTPNSKSATKNYVDKASGEIKYMDRKTKGKHIAGYAFPEEVQYAEALDPVGKEDSDIDNDGDTDKSDKYLHKRRKAIGKAISTRKESFSNWRQDLVEVMHEVEGDKKIKEKKVENKIVINPELKEAVEELGGQLIEMVEIEEGYQPIDRKKENKMYARAGNLARTAVSSTGKKKEVAQKKSSNIVSAITRQKEKERFDRIGQSPAHNEEYQLDEKTLTPAETKKKEQIVKSMKKSAGDFEKRYPGRGKEVMYATATKQAKKLAEEDTQDPAEKRIQKQQQQRMLQLLQQKQRAVRSGMTDISASYEPEGEQIAEKQSALDVVRASIEDKYGKDAVMTGKTKKPKATAAQKSAAQKASADYIKKTSDYLRHSPRD